MNANSDSEHLVRLADGLSIRDLLSDTGATFEVNFEDLQDETEEQSSYDRTTVMEYSKPDCCGIIDEDTYQDGEPFEIISQKMVNVLDDGSIKKRILREGYGTALPDGGMVTVHYNAYIEYNDEPFDSSYLRKKPFTFRMNNGETLPGLDIAVQSMKINEKSQFLVNPKYAYGSLGCLQRVPEDSVVLFEIEVINCVDSGASVSYPNLPKETQNVFAEIYKYAHALCASGNNLYCKDLFKLALRDYNIAVNKLETCQLRDEKDQEKQQKLLLRLLTNLVVTYTKIQEPRRACINANKITNMCKRTSLQIPAKVYFNHARSLILLAEYDQAERKLKQAQQLEPQNVEISKELLKLDVKKKENYNREVTWAKLAFKNTEIEKHEANGITEKFQDLLIQHCKDLIDDADSTQYTLPDNLTKEEVEVCKKEVMNFGLELKYFKSGKVSKYFITKCSTNN